MNCVSVRGDKTDGTDTVTITVTAAAATPRYCRHFPELLSFPLQHFINKARMHIVCSVTWHTVSTMAFFTCRTSHGFKANTQVQSHLRPSCADFREVSVVNSVICRLQTACTQSHTKRKINQDSVGKKLRHCHKYHACLTTFCKELLRRIS